MDAPWKLSDFAAHPWAKSDPPYPLWRHLLDVGAVARALLKLFPTREPVPEALLVAIVGLHDVGKADPLFQLKAPHLAPHPDGALFGALASGWQREIVAFRHEARSAQTLRALLTDKPFGWSRQSAETVCRAIRGHHGNFNASTSAEDEYPPAVAAHWGKVRAELCTMVLRVVGAEVTREPSIEHLDVFGVTLSSVLVASDWIASNTSLFKVEPQVDDPRDHYAHATSAAKRALESLRLVPTNPSSGNAPASWAQLFGPKFTPRGVQQVVCNEDDPIAPGLVIVEASTGEGKTEAALYLASQWQHELSRSGVYFALPTQATSNDLHRRYADFLERNAPGSAPLLVHGMAWLVESATQSGQLDPGASNESNSQQREADAWIRNARRALLAPHAVGTIDQVLLGALAVRFGFLRLLGLGTKVLIVDEVHACDTYMQERLGRILRWCREQRTPVILLSATLARRQREFLVQSWFGNDIEIALPDNEDYPLVSAAPFAASLDRAVRVEARALRADVQRSDARTLSIECATLSDGLQMLPRAIEQRLTGSSSETGCAALIVNTVNGAQKSFRQLQARIGDTRPALLFHSRFPAWRRLEIEREVRSLFGKASQLAGGRPTAALVVATQVLEQSLDVDFDTMVSEVAPIDALLQRAGRLHRHQRHRSTHTPPRLSVLLPTVEEELEQDETTRRISRVYDDLIVWRTIVALQERREVTLPGDYRSLIEAVYSETSSLDGRIPPQRLAVAQKRSSEARERQRSLAQQHLIGPPVRDRFAYPNTAAAFAVDEAEEQESGNNLRAQTRDGEYTMAILALTRDEERDALQRYLRGQRDISTRRTLMEARVPVPTWWLRDARPATTAEHHKCYRFDDEGICEEESRLRFSPTEGVWFEHAP